MYTLMSNDHEVSRMHLDKESLISMYRKMVEIRRFEEKVGVLYSQAAIQGPVHLYIGMESIAVGVCANLREDDYVASTHRGHGHFIARGTQLDKLMAEMMGRSTGTNRGISGSMHLSTTEHGGISQATGIVGGGIPMAVGFALASKFRKKGQVAVSFFGDGAANQGTFHEGINLAAIWKLPVIFVCENNKYANNVPQVYATAVKKIADRGVAYNIPSKTVDGSDVMATYEAAREAIKRARKGEGPTLLECVADRWRPHGEGSLEPRSPEELEKMKRNCPIKRFETKLIEMGILERGETEEIDAAVLKKVEEAVAFAETSPKPLPEEALKYVYA